jgi:hypothetical protein
MAGGGAIACGLAGARPYKALSLIKIRTISRERSTMNKIDDLLCALTSDSSNSQEKSNALFSS